MEQKASADSWLVRRMMKLTPFEKRAMDMPERVRKTQSAAMKLFDQISLPPHPYCLEIGCGQGVMTRLVVERFGARLVATDFDPDQVAAARTRLHDLQEKVEFRIVDAREMPFGDASFDAVFSFGVLHHLIRDWRRALSEASRVLEPQGWFLCTDLLPPRWLERLGDPLLRRLEVLGKGPLLTSLQENGLRLHYFATSGAPVSGLMRHCSFVAQKQRPRGGRS
jgi:ubiquinone/menaquinone biosynthesis C-methylase UbiE